MEILQNYFVLLHLTRQQIEDMSNNENKISQEVSLEENMQIFKYRSLHFQKCSPILVPNNVPDPLDTE